MKPLEAIERAERRLRRLSLYTQIGDLAKQKQRALEDGLTLSVMTIDARLKVLRQQLAESAQ